MRGGKIIYLQLPFSNVKFKKEHLLKAWKNPIWHKIIGIPLKKPKDSH